MAIFNGKPVKLMAVLSETGAGDLTGVIRCFNDIKTLLSKSVFTEDVAALMAQLEAHIEALEDPADIEQDGDILIIRGGVTATQSGATLNLE